MDMNPQDGWAVHAVTHVIAMQGRIDEGIAWLRDCEADWADPANAFAPHNWWHLGLFHLDRGDCKAVLELLDSRLLDRQSDMVLVLIDATAMLWRLMLEGVDVGNRFERVADMWQAKLDIERGHYAFNDVHAMMSFAATGRSVQIQALISQMHDTAQSRDFTSNVGMTSQVDIPLAEAMLAFAQGRYAQAVSRIALVRDRAHRFGGSNAQVAVAA